MFALFACGQANDTPTFAVATATQQQDKEAKSKGVFGSRKEKPKERKRKRKRENEMKEKKGNAKRTLHTSNKKVKFYKALACFLFLPLFVTESKVVRLNRLDSLSLSIALLLLMGAHSRFEDERRK